MQTEKKKVIIVAIVRKTLEEIKAGITPEMLRRFHKAAKREPRGDDPDAPFMTDEQLKEFRRVGRPRVENPKEVISFRVDRDVSAALKKQPKYSGRINDMLRGWLTGIGAL